MPFKVKNKIHDAIQTWFSSLFVNIEGRDNKGMYN